MAEEFKQLSPLEFFYRNKELAGFTNPSRAIYSAVREFVENSLDACELHGIPPQIYLRISLEDQISAYEKIYEILIYDNGSGIPKKELLNAFSKPFYSTKYVFRQSRGIFGLGGTLALLYGQLTTNKPITITSSIGDEYIHSYTFLMDVKGGKPKILMSKRLKNSKRWHGTIVKFSLMGNYPRVSNKIIEYLRQTTIAAPYAEIEFVDPLGRFFLFRRAVDHVPLPPRKIKPHPKGVDIRTVEEMIKANDSQMTLAEFLSKSFHRVGDKIARKFLKNAGFDPEIKLEDLNGDMILKLVNSMRNYKGFLPPSPKVLSPIGEELFKRGIEKEFMPEFLEVITRPPSSYEGHPFIIEAALAYGGKIKGKEGEIMIYRFANKIPLLYDEGSDVTTKVIEDINWSYYKRPEDKPIAFFFHICSTKIPFRSLGKEFIADIPEIEKEIKAAVRVLLRKLTKYAIGKERQRRLKRKIEIYKRYLGKIAEFSTKLVEKEEPPDISRLLRVVREYD